MVGGTVTNPKMDNSIGKGEKAASEDAEVNFKNIANVQKTLIDQQKELIDWLTGQVRKVSQEKPKSFKDHLKERPTQFWIAGLFLAIMSISSLILFFCLYNFSSPTPIPPTFGHDDNLGDGIQVIRREGWNAKPPLKVTKFSGPVKMVRIMHTGGSNCHDLEICAKKVNSLQGWQIGTKGMPDLQYNYMIGGDGNVYVARGPENQGEIRSDSIDIGYMGNFLTPYDKMTDKMEQAGKRLIVKLEKDGYITPDYIVVAQNQTVFTQSPGQNIYKKIVHWPHYDSGIYF